MSTRKKTNEMGAVSALLLALLPVAVLAAPKPEYGVLSLTNTPGPTAHLSYHLYRMPRQPTIAVSCWVDNQRWVSEAAAEKGLDWAFEIDLTARSSYNPLAGPPYPPAGTQICSAWGQDEGSPNGKDATVTTNVLFFEVVQ